MDQIPNLNQQSNSGPNQGLNQNNYNQGSDQPLNQNSDQDIKLPTDSEAVQFSNFSQPTEPTQPEAPVLVPQSPQAQPQPQIKPVEQTQVPIIQAPPMPTPPQSLQPEQYYSSPQIQPDPELIPTPVISRRPRKSGSFLKFIFVVILLAIVSGGAILAMRIWDPVWSPFRPDPEKIISAAFEKITSIKSSHSTAVLELSASGSVNGKATINIDGDAIVGDITDINSIKSQTTAIIKVSADIFNTGTPAEFSVTIKSIMIGTDIYFSISDMDQASVALMKARGFDISPIIGTWIKVPTDQLKQVAQMSPSDFSSQISNVKNLILGNKAFVLKSQQPDETMDGQSVYHYIVSIDNQKLSDLIFSLMKDAATKGAQAASADQGSTDMMLSAVKGMISDTLNKLGEIDFDLFIGKNDNYLYGYKFDKKIDSSVFGFGDFGTYGISASENQSNFNQVADILPPTTYTDLTELPQYKQAQLDYNDGTIKGNISTMIVSAAGISYSANGYLDFSCNAIQVKPSCDAIKAITGVNPIIRSSKKYYCVYSKLLSLSNGQPKYYCANVLGASLETTTDPSKYGYCSGKTYICPK